MASITSTGVIFIIPTICYTKIFWHTGIAPWKIALNAVILVCGLLGCVFGSYYAILAILCDVFNVKSACSTPSITCSSTADIVSSLTSWLS